MKGIQQCKKFALNVLQVQEFRQKIQWKMEILEIMFVITFPTKGVGRLFSPALVDIYVCEQLTGDNSSLIVFELCQSYPWPQGTR